MTRSEEVAAGAGAAGGGTAAGCSGVGAGRPPRAAGALATGGRQPWNPRRPAHLGPSSAAREPGEAGAPDRARDDLPVGLRANSLPLRGTHRKRELRSGRRTGRGRDDPALERHLLPVPRGAADGDRCTGVQRTEPGATRLRVEGGFDLDFACGRLAGRRRVVAGCQQEEAEECWNAAGERTRLGRERHRPAL